MKEIFLLGAGGFVGTVARYYTQQVFGKMTSLPLGTLIVNITGCLAIGFIYGFIIRTELDCNVAKNIKLFFITGLCGGYTTFSSFSYESMEMMQGGDYLNGMLYIVFSVLSGLLSCYIGILVSKLIL